MNAVLFFVLASFGSQWIAELKINDKVIKNLTLTEADLIPSRVSLYEDGSGFEFGIDDTSMLCYYNIEYVSQQEYNLIITVSSIKPKKMFTQLMTKTKTNVPVSAKTGNYSCNIILKN